MSAIKDLREIADVVKEAADFLGSITEQLPRQPLVDELGGCAHWLRETAADLERPIDMVLHCPKCGEQHIDAATETWPNEHHRTHLCHSCGHRWRPADVATNGVAAVKTCGKDDDPIVTPSVLRIAASDVFQTLEKASHVMYVDDAVPYALVEALGKALRGVK